MLADLQTYLPCDLLAKVGHYQHRARARMPQSIYGSSRRRTGGFDSISVPPESSCSQPMLTDTFEELIPRPLATRAKMGFSVPLDRWLRGKLRPLVRQLLLSEQFESRDYFDQRAVKCLVQEHLNGTSDYSQQIWSLLCLEQWQRTFIDPSTAPDFIPSDNSLLLNSTI